MDELFNLIIEQLKASVPELKWLDQDFGQLEVYENPPVLFPVALININIPQWDDWKVASQQFGNAEVIIKIGFDTRQQTNGAMPTLLRQQALSHFETVRKCNKCLTGLRGETCTMRRRASTLSHTSETGIKVYTVTYLAKIIESIV